MKETSASAAYAVHGSATKEIIVLGVFIALLVGLGVHGYNVMLGSDFFQKEYEYWENPGIGYDEEGRWTFLLHMNIFSS